MDWLYLPLPNFPLPNFPLPNFPLPNFPLPNFPLPNVGFMEGVALFLLLLVVSTALMRRVRGGRAGIESRKRGRGDRAALRLPEIMPTLDSAARKVVGAAVQGGGASSTAAWASLDTARGRFDPDVLYELHCAAADRAAMWTALREKFGPSASLMHKEQRQFADPWLVRIEVRRLRALDEQFQRLGLGPAPRPDGWATYYAAGRIDLPDPVWRGRADDPETRVDGPGARQRHLAALAAQLPGALPRRLLHALLEEAALHPVLSKVQVVPVPPNAGRHGNYTIAPWEAAYLHLFADPLPGACDPALVMVYGLRGRMFRNAAVRIVARDATDSGATRQRLLRAGYRVFSFPEQQVDDRTEVCAHRICAGIAPLFAGTFEAGE